MSKLVMVDDYNDLQLQVTRLYAENTQLRQQIFELKESRFLKESNARLLKENEQFKKDFDAIKAANRAMKIAIYGDNPPIRFPGDMMGHN